MKIQRSPLKNKTINNHSKLRLNPKIFRKYSSKKFAKRTNEIGKSMITFDNTKLNFIYMALNKTIKLNNIECKDSKNNNINNIPIFHTKNIRKRNKNKSCILQNVFLAKTLNMEYTDNSEKNDLETNISNNSIIKKVNMSKYFINNYNKNGQKSDYDYKYNNKKQKCYNSIGNTKTRNKIFPFMKIKSNIKFIKQYPFFKDLNLRPSSEKSWLFTYEKKNTKDILNKDKYSNNNNKRIIPKFHFIKNTNSSNLEYKSKNFNNFILDNNNINNINNVHNLNNNNYNNINSNNNLYQERIKKNDNIIFGYNYIHNRNYNNFREKSSQTSIKRPKIKRANYANNFIKKKNIKRNSNKDKNNVFRMKSSKTQNNIYKNIINNRIIYLKHNNENKKNMDNDYENLIMINNSFSDNENEKEDFTFLNPIYS